MGKRELWDALRERGYSEKAAAVILGHAQAESGCECDRVQGDFSTNRALSKSYTVQVDTGAIDRAVFAYNGPNGGGYGLVQWTFPTRKLGLYDTAKRLGVSIGSEKAAVWWLNEELHNGEYIEVLYALRSDKSIREMSDVFMHRFERPADQSEAACAYRAGLAQQVYDEFATGEDKPDEPIDEGEEDKPDSPIWPPRVLCEGMLGADVGVLQWLLTAQGYGASCDEYGVFGEDTGDRLAAFQEDHGLAADRIAGPKTFRVMGVVS